MEEPSQEVSYAQILLRKVSYNPSSPSSQGPKDIVKESPVHNNATIATNNSPFSNNISRDNPKFHSFPRYSNGKLRNQNSNRNRTLHQQRTPLQPSITENAPSYRQKNRRSQQQTPFQEENHSLQKEKKESLPLLCDSNESSSIEKVILTQQVTNPSSEARSNNKSQLNYGKPSFSDILRRNSHRTTRINSTTAVVSTISEKKNDDKNILLHKKECFNVIESRSSQAVQVQTNIDRKEVSDGSNLQSLTLSLEKESIPDPSVRNLELTQTYCESTCLKENKLGYDSMSIQDSSSYAGILTKGISNVHPLKSIPDAESLYSKKVNLESDCVPIIPVLEVEADLFRQDGHRPIPGLLFRADLSRRPSKKRKRHKNKHEEISEKANQAIVIQEFHIPEVGGQTRSESSSINESKKSKTSHIQNESQSNEIFLDSTTSGSRSYKDKDTLNSRHETPHPDGTNSKKSMKKDPSTNSRKTDACHNILDCSSPKETSDTSLSNSTSIDTSVKSKKCSNSFKEKGVSKRPSKKSKMKFEEEDVDEIVKNLEKSLQVKSLQRKDENNTVLSRRQSKKIKNKQMENETNLPSKNMENENVSKEETLSQIMKRLEYIEGGISVEKSESTKDSTCSQLASSNDPSKIKKYESYGYSSKISASTTVAPSVDTKTVTRESKLNPTDKNGFEMSKENDIKQLNHSNDDLNLCKKEKMKEYVRKDVKGKKDTVKKSDSMVKKVKGKSDPLSVKQVDTTTEDKNSDKCKEKKDYDLVDDSCDDHLNAGIRDASGSIDKEIKVKTDTLSVKEANTIPEDKGTDKSKEKKSYYFVGDSCDDGMDARKGDIYDTMGDEVKGRTDTISVKEPKMTPEDKSSDKCKEKKSYDFVDDSCDDRMNAGIGDISDSMDEDMKGKTDTLSVKEPKMMPEDKSSDKPKEKKSYDFVDDSCDDWMDTRKGDISDAMGEEVKGRTDTISVKEPKMTPEDKSSDKCKEKKSYDFVDDSCDDWMNAGIGDISDSMDEDMKVKTDTLSVKEANTIPEEKSSDNPKEKKSYDFVGDSCDDGMDPGIGNISDSMDEEVKGRTDTLSIKEPKMMPEDKSSDKSKEKKSYDFVDDSCDHNMNAGIGGTFYSNEAYLNENKNSKSVLQDLIRCSPDKQTESQKKERTYSSIASHLVTEVKMENSDINVTSNYSSYPALIVVVEDNKPKLEKELDSEGYETVLTKKERRRKLNSLRLSATECEDSLKEIEEIINSDIDRNIRCSSFPQPADVNTFSTNEIIPSKIETDDNQIDCVRPFEPKDPNESAVKEEYQNELTRVPVDNVSNNTSIMENVLLKNDEKSNHTINEVKEKTVKVVDSTDENVFTKEHTSFLKKEMTQILDHTELAHIPMKNNSQEASDCLNEFLVQSIDTGNLCNQESSSTYKNEKINHEKLNIPPLEKVVNKYSNDDNCSSVTSNSGSYVPLRRILSSSSVNNALKEKSEFSATMINLDHESNDIIRNIASKSTSSTRPSSRSSFSEDRFDSARRYSFKKRDSMDLSSGFSSSRASPMNTTSRQYVRIRDLRSSGTESVNNNIDDITKINTNEEGNVGSPSLNTDSQINEKLVKSVDKVDTEIEVIHLSSKFEMVKKISGISMKNFNESLFNEEVDDCGKSLSRNNYESRDSKAEGHIFTMDNMSNEEAKFSSSFVSTDILSQQIQITSDKDSSTEIDFENISGKKKKSKKRMKHSVDVGSSKTSTSEDVYVCEIKEMDSKSSCLKDTNLDRQQPVSSLSSMDESTMKHFDQMKDKVIKKRKRPRNILSKSYNNIESTTTDSDEMKGESECKEEVIDDNEDSSPILADVNLNDLADSLIEEDEDKIMAEEQSLTSISADDEEFEELMMNSSEKVLWSTLARVPPRPPSPIPIEEKNKDSSSSVSRNTQFCLRTKEHLTTPMNKKIFDKDGYEIHVSRRTRTNSRNSQIELDENVIPLSQLKPAPIKSILDVAKDDGHFNILRDNPDERSQEDKLFKVDVKEKSILPDIVPSHKFNSKNILNLENVLDEESKASRRISSHDDAIISVSNLRVRGPQLIDTSNINIDYKSKSELIRNLQLDIFSHFMLQSSLTDAELKMSQLLMKENCSKNDIKCSLNESLNDGCCKASSNICRSKELSHISIESKSLSTPNYSELALRDNSDNNNCDDKTIGKYSLESEEVGVMKMSNFQVLVSELSEDVTDLGILLKGLNENDISEAIASTQYALKSVNEFNKEADKLELRIKESGLNSSEVSSLTNEIFDVKKEIKSFDNKVKSLEISMQNYMKDSQSRKEEIRKYHSLLLDLEGWCDGIQLTNKIEPAQAKDYYTKSLNSAKVLEYDLNSQSQELSSLIHEAQALSEFGDVKKMSETLIKRLKDLKAIVDHTSSMLPERINILKVQKRSSRNVSFVST